MTRAWAIALALGLFTSGASARDVEDILQGRFIVSEREIPTDYKSPTAYAHKLKRMHRKQIEVGGTTTLHCAAFFAEPVPDGQVDVVVFDESEEKLVAKRSWDAFLARPGDRALFVTLTLGPDDVPLNRSYKFAVVSRRRLLASGTILLTAAPRRVTPQTQDFTK